MTLNFSKIYKCKMTWIICKVNHLFNWSMTSFLLFNPTKSCHLSFNQKFQTSYTINGSTIISLPMHKDLGYLVSANLEWGLHQDTILSKAYKMLGLICRTFSQSISSSVKSKLYITLGRSQIMYCSPVCMVPSINEGHN